MKKKQQRKPYTRQPNSNPPGRPPILTQEMQDRICAHVADGGTVREFCKQHKHIAYGTVFNFMALESGEKFRAAFTHARESGTHAMAEQCVEIADEKTNDPARARLRVDTRLRLIGQWNRRVYGPKQDVEVSARTTLGELVEASMRLAAKQNEQPAMLDITPAALPLMGARSEVIDPPADQSPARAPMEVIRERVRAITRPPRRTASS